MKLSLMRALCIFSLTVAGCNANDNSLFEESDSSETAPNQSKFDNNTVISEQDTNDPATPNDQQDVVITPGANETEIISPADSDDSDPEKPITEPDTEFEERPEDEDPNDVTPDEPEVDEWDNVPDEGDDEPGETDSDTDPEPAEGESEPTEVSDIPPVYAAGTTLTNITARRVAKKINIWGKKEIAKGFEPFDVDDADYSVLYNTRIAEIADPEIHKTVMFMAAGQKPPIGTHPNGLTGQGPKWFDTCDKTECPNQTVDGRSLSMKLRALNWFEAETTWLAMAFDTNFDYTTLKKKRERLFKGYLAWLKTKITTDTENIVLGGASRGGCISMLLAQALREDPAYDHIQIYVMSFDGVCNRGDELGTTFTKIINPVRKSGTYYGGWATDMNAQFPNQNNLHIFHISGGQEVVTATGVRAFSAYEGTTPPKTGTNINWGWYKQKWVPWAHREIGSAYVIPDEADQDQVVSDTIDSQLWWLENVLKK